MSQLPIIVAHLRQIPAHRHLFSRALLQGRFPRGAGIQAKKRGRDFFKSRPDQLWRVRPAAALNGLLAGSGRIAAGVNLATGSSSGESMRISEQIPQTRNDVDDVDPAILIIVHGIAAIGSRPAAEQPVQKGRDIADVEFSGRIKVHRHGIFVGTG